MRQTRVVRKAISLTLLLLSLGCGAAIVVSYRPTPYYTIVLSAREGGDRRPIELSVYKGDFCIDHYHYEGIGRSPKEGWRWYAVLNETTPSTRMWEADHWVRSPRPPRWIQLRIPLWLMSAVFGVYPAMTLLIPFLRDRHCSRRGLCRGCGYDLTGLIEPRCPECATPFEPRVVSQGRRGDDHARPS